MNDPLARAMTPSQAALAKLEVKRAELTEFASCTAQVLTDLGFPGSTTVLVNRNFGDQSQHELDTGWKLRYFNPSTMEQYHLRNLYLLVDGTFALDAISDDRKRYLGETSAWIKIQAHDHPDLVPMAVNEIRGIASCKQVTMALVTLLNRYRAYSDELVERFWPRQYEQ